MALTHTDTGAHPRQSGFPPRRSPAPPPDPLKANIHSSSGTKLVLGATFTVNMAGSESIGPSSHRAPFQRTSLNLRQHSGSPSADQVGCMAS